MDELETLRTGIDAIKCVAVMQHAQMRLLKHLKVLPKVTANEILAEVGKLQLDFQLNLAQLNHKNKSKYDDNKQQHA